MLSTSAGARLAIHCSNQQARFDSTLHAHCRASHKRCGLGQACTCASTVHPRAVSTAFRIACALLEPAASPPRFQPRSRGTRLETATVIAPLDERRAPKRDTSDRLWHHHVLYVDAWRASAKTVDLTEANPCAAARAPHTLYRLASAARLGSADPRASSRSPSTAQRCSTPTRSTSLLRQIALAPTCRLASLRFILQLAMPTSTPRDRWPA